MTQLLHATSWFSSTWQQNTSILIWLQPHQAQKSSFCRGEGMGSFQMAELCRWFHILSAEKYEKLTKNLKNNNKHSCTSSIQNCFQIASTSCCCCCCYLIWPTKLNWNFLQLAVSPKIENFTMHKEPLIRIPLSSKWQVCLLQNCSAAHVSFSKLTTAVLPSRF